MVELKKISEIGNEFSKSFLLSGLSAAQITAVKKASKRTKVSTGQALFFQSDPGDALYIVLGGTLEVSVLSSGGKKLTLNIMKTGDVIGEIAALDGGPRTASVIAMKDSELLRFERSTLLEMLKRDADFTLEIIFLLCSRLRWINQQVEDLGLLNTEGRLANRLVILARKFSDSSGLLKLSQSELADFLGVTRESTNKILQDWRSRGLVDTSRGAIQVQNFTALERIAESRSD